MNYDYSYRFNGDPNAVHFSDGKFRSIRLNETNLNEVVNFPERELSFLTQEPYRYKLQPISSSQTSVDWNRNGIFRESNVQADINDGVSKNLGPYLHLNHTSGAPALTSVNSYLYLIYPKGAGSPGTWTTAKTVVGPRGYDLYYQSVNVNTPSAEKPLVKSIVRSDPSATGVGNMLAVGFITVNQKPMIYGWKTDNVGMTNYVNTPGIALDISQSADQVILTTSGRKRWSDAAVVSPEENKLWMFTWNESSKEIRAVRVEYSLPGANNRPTLQIPSNTSSLIMEGANPIRSELPIGAAFNRTTQKMILVTTGRNWGYDNRIKVYTLRLVDNKWVYESHRWVGFASSGYSTNAAPTIVIDDTRLGGPEGIVTIYVKGNVPANDASQVFSCRMIGDRTYHDGWRVSMMGNQWTSSKSPAAATLMGDNIAFAIRWDGGPLNNQIVFYRTALGVEDFDLLDYDDINHISTVGLKNAIDR